MACNDCLLDTFLPYSAGTEFEYSLQPGKKCGWPIFGFRSERSLHWIFEKSAPVLLGQYFHKQLFVLTFTKTENAYISTGKSPIKTFYTSVKFWNEEDCVIPFYSIIAYFCLFKYFLYADVNKNHENYMAPSINFCRED